MIFNSITRFNRNQNRDCNGTTPTALFLQIRLAWKRTAIHQLIQSSKYLDQNTNCRKQKRTRIELPIVALLTLLLPISESPVRAMQQTTAPTAQDPTPPPVNTPISAEGDGTRNTAARRIFLLRGPVHEAFAELHVLRANSGTMTSRRPPAPLIEKPPEKPTSEPSLEWIPGYWDFDATDDRFIWVSGIWRRPPPGRSWSPGVWSQHDAAAFFRTLGTWVPDDSAAMLALPKDPPITRERGPIGNPPSTQHIWIPGCWNWLEPGYTWRPGYWSRGHVDWIWIPDRYFRTVKGFLFVPGYWDYPLGKRGHLFAPMVPTLTNSDDSPTSYSPSVAIATDRMVQHLWVRPESGQYYFGNFYTDWNQRGLVPWHQWGVLETSPVLAEDSELTEPTLSNLQALAFQDPLRAHIAHTPKHMEAIPRPSDNATSESEYAYINSMKEAFNLYSRDPSIRPIGEYPNLEVKPAIASHAPHPATNTTEQSLGDQSSDELPSLRRITSSSTEETRLLGQTWRPHPPKHHPGNIHSDDKSLDPHNKNMVNKKRTIGNHSQRVAGKSTLQATGTATEVSNPTTSSEAQESDLFQMNQVESQPAIGRGTTRLTAPELPGVATRDWRDPRNFRFPPNADSTGATSGTAWKNEVVNGRFIVEKREHPNLADNEQAGLSQARSVALGTRPRPTIDERRSAVLEALHPSSNYGRAVGQSQNMSPEARRQWVEAYQRRQGLDPVAARKAAEDWIDQRNDWRFQEIAPYRGLPATQRPPTREWRLPDGSGRDPAILLRQTPSGFGSDWRRPNTGRSGDR